VIFYEYVFYQNYLDGPSEVDLMGGPRMKEISNGQKILVRNPEGKRPLRGLSKDKNNNNMYIKYKYKYK
jgi:hypothetical protein